MGLANLLGTLARYAEGASAGNDVEQDFDHVSQNASQPHLAGGIANAFRSDQTPPFAQMVSQLFSNSNGDQRAGILNKLISAAGPAAASSGILGRLLGQSSGQQISPEQAQQVPPDAVHELAARAEKNNPSIVDQAGQFYSQPPPLVKALGAGALAPVMSHMSRNQA
jgi:hypothetical protein